MNQPDARKSEKSAGTPVPGRNGFWVCVAMIMFGFGFAASAAESGRAANAAGRATNIDDAGNPAGAESTAADLPAASAADALPALADGAPLSVERAVHPFGGDDEFLAEFTRLASESPPSMAPLSLPADDDECSDVCEVCGQKPCVCPDPCPHCDNIPCVCFFCPGCDQRNVTHPVRDGCLEGMLTCQSCSCCGCTQHEWPDYESAKTKSTATVSITYPTATPLKIRINTEQSFIASGVFDPGFIIPESWNYIETTRNEATYTWTGATGNGASASQEFKARGDQSVSVNYVCFLEQKYMANRKCNNCDETQSETQTIKAGASATAATGVRVHTLKLEIKPRSNGSWGGGATIGAGGVGSDPHRADVRASLDPEDPSISFAFPVAWNPKDGDWGDPWWINAGGGVVHTITSTNLIGDGGTLAGRESGATSSVSANYAWAFSPAPSLDRQSDGSLSGSAGVKNGSIGLDGHSLRLTMTSMTVQRWDDEAKELVTETRTTNLPTPQPDSFITDAAGQAVLTQPRPGERILAATYQLADRTVLRKANAGQSGGE